MDEPSPFDLSFKTWVVLFILGFFTRPFAIIGSFFLRRVSFVETNEIGHALVGGTVLGLGWGLVQSGDYIVASGFHPTILLTIIEDTFGGLALAFVVTVAHDFLELVGKLKGH